MNVAWQLGHCWQDDLKPMLRLEKAFFQGTVFSAK
jgi:hypothetical protein